MIDPIGASAIKSLGIDVANLTSRLAIQTALLDEILGRVMEIDQGAWVHNQLTDENGETSGEYATTMPGTETDKVQALLAFIASLQ